MSFANAEYLLLLLLIVPYIFWHFFYAKRKEPVLKYTTTLPYRYMKKTLREHFLNAPFILRVITFSMVVIVLARPQTSNSLKKVNTQGIDIMLAVDISTSMLAEDLKPNRIEAAKLVANEFISGRPNDNIGITTFAGEAFTQCPMTVDHVALLNMLKDVSPQYASSGLIEDGTAIGMGLMNAISRLKESNAKSKVIILLTDGSNNRGEVSPLTAADIASKYNIRVYTIAAGTEKEAPYPIPLPGGGYQYVNMKVDVDNETLSQIADKTDGLFFKATSNAKLQSIYKEIDKLERTRITIQKYDKKYEAYQPFALIACICFLLEILLRFTWLKRIPS